MNPNQTLEKILTDYGRTVLQNSRLVESLFKDLCYEPEYKREVNILILALKEDIPQRLINANPVTEHLKKQLAQKIEDTYSVPVQHGKVAVDTWENALYPNKVKSSNTVPTQPQTPKVQKPVQPVTPIAKSTQQPTIPFSDELDQGVWTDPNTGLMWARISIGQQWINGKCVGDAKELNWRDAQNACKEFDLASFNDWRLPTIEELKTLMLQGKGYNCPKDLLFQPMKNDYGFYWSISLHDLINYRAWGMDFNSYYSLNLPEKYCHYYVRAVRGQAKITLPQPTIQKSVQPVTPIEKPTPQQITQPISELDQGVWTDPNTGLMWSRISIGQQWENGKCVGETEKLNWEDAQIACKNFRLADFNDWRLPSIDELKTLMIQSKSGYNSPSNTLLQPKKDDWGFYWSSSPNTYNDTYAWLVYFSLGYSGGSDKYNYRYVRAVRSSQ